ncbi:hypothetical protein GQX74_004364 [Glossina fuscipes]|nr:hypothetical protein GQX74_004364 [Glossina fuscipes]
MRLFSTPQFMLRDRQHIRNKNNEHFNRKGIGGKLNKPLRWHLTPYLVKQQYYGLNRLAVIIIGIVTVILGILLTTIPWLDYFILQVLRLKIVAINACDDDDDNDA